MRTRVRNVSKWVAIAGFTAMALAEAVAQPSLDQIVRGLRFRSIGPAVMSGRISDIEVDPRNTAVIYVASASGGVWKTTNGGLSWRPITDELDSASMGDVTVSAANPDIVWVGSGESNNRNSVGWGRGVYLSKDGGGTWQNVGLKETQQIARIVTHPKDPNVAWVAAIGPLWNASEHRGVYKTTDGGKTWRKVLYVDENTGASDIIIDPSNPNVLYAGMYERRRFPWTFRSGGPNGGIFKSTNGGESWTKLANGLPKGQTGKIVLTIYPKNPKILYAIIEAEGRGTSNDQNGVYRSEDGGASWKRMGTFDTRPFYYHEIVVDPNDDKHLFAVSTNLMESRDGGARWRGLRLNIHVDFHAVWINPANSNHIITGSDGGVAVSFDGAQTFWFMEDIPVSQFYDVTYDMAFPYHVYGGLQDNGSWGGPSVSRNRSGIGNWEWYRIGGGDGFYVQVDPTDNATIYSESQGGAIGRRNKKTGETRSIRPRAQGIRYNWSSPIVMSPHNPKIIWFGGNVLWKTIDGGNNWVQASPDLTTNDPEKQKPMGGLTPERTGAETHCTIITISESPLQADLVWVGTDDGLVHVTENGGKDWTNVTANIQGVPANTWVSRVAASAHRRNRCYVTFDGHRTGDFKPYVFVTEDLGKTWTNIAANLPADESVYVIKEDPYNENLLFVGTEFGLYVSIDRGKSWARWKTNLPTVAVHDIEIHPREREIILGTHGRGIFIAPIEVLEALNENAMKESVVLADPVDAYQWVADATGGYGDGDGWYFGENPPFGGRISYYLNQDAEVTLEILDAAGAIIARIPNAPGSAGANVAYWNFRRSGQQGGGGPGGGGFQGGGGLLPPGTYGVRIKVGDKTVVKPITVRPDPDSQ